MDRKNFSIDLLWEKAVSLVLTLFIMDDFTINMVGRCVDAIKNCGTKVDYILPGYKTESPRLEDLELRVDVKSSKFMCWTKYARYEHSYLGIFVFPLLMYSCNNSFNWPARSTSLKRSPL